MRKYSERGFKNLEFLRFLLIFAVVGVHLAYLNLYFNRGILLACKVGSRLASCRDVLFNVRIFPVLQAQY